MRLIMNIIETLKLKIQKALSPVGLSLSDNDIIIENTKNPEHGDYATNVALKFANKVGLNPRELANKLIENIDKDGIDKIEIAGPGFVNFFMKKDALNLAIAKIIDEGDNYGRGEKKNKKINVEFVSANPTGDLHLGHARCAAVGDTICRLYEFAGYDVTREFYVNDAGHQIQTLGESLRVRYHQLFGEKIELPEDSYHAQDIVNIATEFKNEYGDKYLLDSEENFKFLTQYQVSQEITNQISLNSYMGIFLMMIFVMGLVFEMPVLAWLLSKLGVLTKSFLKKYRKHAVVILLALAALITPTGDPFTLMVVFGPLYLLYEFSLFIVKDVEAEVKDSLDASAHPAAFPGGRASRVSSRNSGIPRPVAGGSADMPYHRMPPDPVQSQQRAWRCPSRYGHRGAAGPDLRHGAGGRFQG